MLIKNLYNMVKSYLSHYSVLIYLMLFAVQSNQNVFCLLLELQVLEIEVYSHQLKNLNTLLHVSTHACQMISYLYMFGL